MSFRLRVEGFGASAPANVLKTDSVSTTFTNINNLAPQQKTITLLSDKFAITGLRMFLASPLVNYFSNDFVLSIFNNSSFRGEYLNHLSQHNLTNLTIMGSDWTTGDLQHAVGDGSGDAIGGIRSNDLIIFNDDDERGRVDEIGVGVSAPNTAIKLYNTPLANKTNGTTISKIVEIDSVNYKNDATLSEIYLKLESLALSTVSVKVELDYLYL